MNEKDLKNCKKWTFKSNELAEYKINYNPKIRQTPSIKNQITTFINVH
jgi:hypothetical protein